MGGSGRIPSLRPGRARRVLLGSPPTTRVRPVGLSRGTSGILGSCGRRRGLRWRRSSAGSSRSGDNARRRFQRRAGVIGPNDSGGGPRDPAVGLAGRLRAPQRQEPWSVVRFAHLCSRLRYWPCGASSGYTGTQYLLKVRSEGLARPPARARRPRRQQRTRERPGRPSIFLDRCIEVGGSGRWAAPAVASWPGAPGAWLALLPPVFGSARAPKVDCKPGSGPTPGYPKAGEDHSSRRRIAASFEHSDPDAGGRALRRSDFEWVALDSIPIRACSGRGLPRRRSPGCRAWALTPRFQPCLCLCEDASRHLCFNGHRRFGFCCAFPRVAPGRR